MTVNTILTPKRRRKLLRCVECGQKPTILGWTDSLYPDEPHLHGRRALICECGAFVRCHKRFAGSATGAPANSETRVLRSKAYDAALAMVAADPVASKMELPDALQAVRSYLSAQLSIPMSKARFDQLSAVNAARALEVLK